MRTMVIGLNTIEKTLWWKVDLGGVFNIYGVNIQYKNYEGYGVYIITDRCNYLTQYHTYSTASNLFFLVTIFFHFTVCLIQYFIYCVNINLNVSFKNAFTLLGLHRCPLII